MATQTLQGNRSLRIIPSDNCNIPYPGVIVSGTNGALVANKLVDPTATFITSGVKEGDVVYNETDQTAATVLKVETEHTLLLNANIYTAGGKSYTIYNPCLKESAPCLYIGGEGDVVATSSGGDTTTWVGFATSQWIPFHFIKVFAATTAENINAVW